MSTYSQTLTPSRNKRCRAAQPKLNPTFPLGKGPLNQGANRRGPLNSKATLDPARGLAWHVIAVSTAGWRRHKFHAHNVTSRG